MSGIGKQTSNKQVKKVAAKKSRSSTNSRSNTSSEVDEMETKHIHVVPERDVIS